MAKDKKLALLPLIVAFLLVTPFDDFALATIFGASLFRTGNSMFEPTFEFSSRQLDLQKTLDSRKHKYLHIAGYAAMVKVAIEYPFSLELFFSVDIL
jgi:hypothetical protein